MAIEKAEVLTALRRVKGPDLTSNIVDLGLVSEILIKDNRAYFSITVPAARAHELEQLRLAAEAVVAELKGIQGVTAVLTAEATEGSPAPKRTVLPIGRAEHPRVQAARAKGATGDGSGPRQAAAAAAASASRTSASRSVSTVRCWWTTSAGRPRTSGRSAM